jgi:hypothetical protein
MNDDYYLTEISRTLRFSKRRVTKRFGHIAVNAYIYLQSLAIYRVKIATSCDLNSADKKSLPILPPKLLTQESSYSSSEVKLPDNCQYLPGNRSPECPFYSCTGLLQLVALAKYMVVVSITARRRTLQLRRHIPDTALVGLVKLVLYLRAGQPNRKILVNPNKKVC